MVEEVSLFFRRRMTMTLRKGPFRFVLFCGFVLLCAVGGGVLLAQIVEQVQAGPVSQVFALTTSNDATYSNPSGAIVPMPSTALTFTLDEPSLLTIAFSARGTVEPSGSEIIPIVFIGCQIDGQPCQPNTNSIEFLYPQFCCDTRSFQWAVARVLPGNHKVQILWGMGNPTSADVSDRSLVVQAATEK
jgi:hypothetical protein